MLDLYITLALSAFIAATILPFASELALGTAIVAGADPWLALMVASISNTTGSAVNYFLGRGLVSFENKRWFPAKPAQLAAAQHRFEHYGLWSLLFAWVPLIGDPLTVIAGVLKVRFIIFITLVGIGKTLRYAVIIAITMSAT